MLKKLAVVVSLIWLAGLSVVVYRLWEQTPVLYAYEQAKKRQTLMCEDALERRRQAQAASFAPIKMSGGSQFILADAPSSRGYHETQQRATEAEDDIKKFCR